MEYKFAASLVGPLVVGADEVITAHQFPQLMDYHDNNPQFLDDYKTFVADCLRDLTDRLCTSMWEQVVGEEELRSLPEYLNAAYALKEFTAVISQPDS